MRNNSGELLRRVEGGESVQISNHGRVVAVIQPVDDGLAALAERGQARLARTPVTALAGIRRTTSTATTKDIIEDSRGRW